MKKKKHVRIPSIKIGKVYNCEINETDLESFHTECWWEA